MRRWASSSRSARMSSGSAPGDRVVVAFNIACGTCWFCARARPSSARTSATSAPGRSAAGSPARRPSTCACPFADVNLLAIPDGVDDERALFVGDVLTTGFYAASIAGIRPSETVAVVGCGPVGFFCVQAARAWAPAQVFALDREPERLALAERVGAVPVDVARAAPADGARRGAPDGRGADVVIEAVGTPAAFESAVRRRAPRRPRRRRRHVRGRVGRGAAGRLLGARARRSGSRGSARSTPGGSARWPRSVAGRIDPLAARVPPAPARGRAGGLRAVRPRARRRRWCSSRDGRATLDDRSRSGLASIVGGLIEQNLDRDPRARRLLRPAVVTIVAHDADVGVTIAIEPGQRATSRTGSTRRAHLRVAADTSRCSHSPPPRCGSGCPTCSIAEGERCSRRRSRGGCGSAGWSGTRGALARLTPLLSVA